MREMTEITIDPVTRIEGHLEISVTTGGDPLTVTEAYSHGNMFRGIEKILIGRDPRDAPTITSRICGVCHAVHRLTSLRAIEDAAGFKFPNRTGTTDFPNGARILRNLIQAVTTIYSHAASLYVLSGPDYSNAGAGTGLTRLDPFTGAGYLEALEAQRILHEVLGILGGKVPHQVTAVPGGMSLAPTEDTINAILAKLTASSDKLQNYSVLDWVNNLAVPDILAMVSVAADLGAGDWGVGSGKFLCVGVYDLENQDQFLRSGVYDGNSSFNLDPELITEDVTSGRYTSASGGYPGATVTEQDLVKDAYTWYKAPRYDNMVVEVGPLARLVVNDSNPGDLRTDPNKSSTLNRLIARAQEILILIPKVVDWLNELNAELPLAPEDVYAPYEINRTPVSGIGLWEAPRGAAVHWVTIDKPKPSKPAQITQYQAIAGTTWNGGGRDALGQPGPFEQSLVGVPYVPDDSAPPGSPASEPAINVLRTIRSYDPCLGCSIHMLTPKGKKYTVRAV